MTIPIDVFKYFKTNIKLMIIIGITKILSLKIYNF